jgi:hypothetical protein
MKRKIAALAMLTVSIVLLASAARADTLVKVTVHGPDGRPAAGVAVTIRPAAGYGNAAGDVEPPAVVGAGVTGSDGTVNLRLAAVRPYDVYSIGADDKAGGRHASTAVFAAETRWPTPILTLESRASAINIERTAAGEAAAICDQTAYAMHVQNIHEAVAQQVRSVATLENAIAQYAGASGVAGLDLDAARAQLAAARQQQGATAADRVATLQHYVLLRVLADNNRTGLEADRVNEQIMASLDQCSNETKAGVEMLARCPPGWQLARQNVAQSSCHQRSVGTGREQN